MQTFWLEKTDQVAVGLRRYTDGGEHYHSALVYTGLEPARYEESQGHRYLAEQPELDHADPRWPSVCEDCAYEFADGDRWQMWQEQVYRRTDTGGLRVLHRHGFPEAPTAEPGACWDAWWMPFSKGPDGLHLMVRCPDGDDWHVDSRASNCTLPDDKEHRCWVRHGDPRECRVTVDKNGLTCQAGAGSIQTRHWHGFLREGQLVA